MDTRLTLIRFLLYIVLITLSLSVGYLYHLQTCTVGNLGEWIPQHDIDTSDSEYNTAKLSALNLLLNLTLMKIKKEELSQSNENLSTNNRKAADVKDSVFKRDIDHKDTEENKSFTSGFMQNIIQDIKKELYKDPPPQLADGIDFSVSPIFRFPHPSLFKYKEQVISTMWSKTLQEFLKKIHPSKRVTITIATYDFLENLLNWLVSAQVISKPPLSNVLVLCFDEKIFRFLADKKLNALYVPYYSVLKNPQLDIGNIWLTRMAVIRLMNHWGYDVQHFDSDAVILKNPEPLFEKFKLSDIIGSWGDYPDELGKKGSWIATICLGAVLFRSSLKTELLWQYMGEPILDISIVGYTIGTPAYLRKFTKYTTDDQCRLNFALKNFGMKWTPARGTVAKGKDENGLEVVILPQTDICRHICVSNSTLDFYVSHAVGGAHNAEQKALRNSQSNAWFLRKDWNTTIKLTGMEWLRNLEAGSR